MNENELELELELIRHFACWHRADSETPAGAARDPEATDLLE
jgi:hypothetical protein